MSKRNRHHVTIFVMLLIVSSTASAKFEITRCDGRKFSNLSELVDAQTSQPFNAKFQSVTPDLEATSHTNVRKLTTTLTGHLNQIDLSDAHVLADAVLRQSVLVHSTSEAAAASILSSGQILSKDELYRRKIINAENYSHGNTGYLTDGFIGEQDVVYLAFQKKSRTDAYSFGEVSFLFDIPKTMKKSYFSLSSFSTGNPFKLPAENDCSALEMERARRQYHFIIFEGRELNKLVELSAIQTLWNRKHLLALKTLADKFNGGSTELADRQVDCEAMKITGQMQDCDDKTFSLIKITGSYSLEKVTSAEDVIALLASFTTFPTYSENQVPTFLWGSHSFWEVKVPQSLSLETLQAILTDAHSKLEPAIYTLGQRLHRRVGKTVLPSGRVQYTFSSGDLLH